MEISRDALAQSLRRLSIRLLELNAWCDRDRQLIEEGEFRTRPDASWSKISLGEPWPAIETPVEIQFETVIPKNWAGSLVHGRFQLGGEALLFMNGRPMGGLNSLHQEYPLLSEAKGGETLRFQAQVVPHGLFGTPVPQPRLDLACILVPEEDARALYRDLATALDAAGYLARKSRVALAEALLGAIHRAFRETILPRNDTEEYLARIAVVSENQPADDFYGNEERPGSLWERWKFRSPSGSLTTQQRSRLREVRTAFAAELAQLRDRFPPEGQAWLTGHAHLDLAWLWPLEETRRKARRTFYSVVGLMERYPELRFNQSSAQVYAWIEHDDPALFREIQGLVRNGQWDIVGGMWVEPDGNLPCGESWVRQLLFGQRYFQSRFAQGATVAWLPDSFGFNGNLPQLLLSAGIPNFFTHKLTWNERNPFPYDLYWWEGIDGSRVLAHSFSNPDNGYNARLTALELGETWRRFRGKAHHDATLLAFGYGDGGGGPTEEMLERFRRFRDFPGMPNLRMDRVVEYYKTIAAQSLPVWVGEKYLEYHRATFTTQGKVKLLHRQLEHALVEAESAAVLAALQRQMAYPEAPFRRLWEILLLNEFHDILPGSSIHTVYETAHRQLAAALDECSSIRDRAISSGKGNQEPESAKDLEGLIWNLQMDDRPLLAEIAADPQEPTRRIIAGEKEVVTQQLEGGRLLIWADEVLVPGLGALPLRSVPGEPGAMLSGIQTDSTDLETEKLRIRVNGDGTLASLFDKDCGREVLAGRGNQLWLFTDIPRQFDAWDIDASYAEEGIELCCDTAPECIETGPLRGAIRVRHRHEQIEITQDYRLSRGSGFLEIRTRVRWHGRRQFLRALFPLEIRTHETWAETAFGAVARSNHRNTPWDEARFEMPMHRWADVSEPNYGVSLLNIGKYGYNVNGSVLGISLLRSPIYPDPYADEGDHEFVYGIYPHRGTWRNGTVQAARRLHSPLRFAAGRDDAKIRSSLFRLRGDTVELAALKKAEDSEDILLRFYEPHGNRARTTIEMAVRVR
ncbi:MAG: alpha-mannosidase, partial [Verrucomicrobia bacterium]|nr:alpha-mannosidase [Verrucomicrobiota bacterium]